MLENEFDTFWMNLDDSSLMSHYEAVRKEMVIRKKNKQKQILFDKQNSQGQEQPKIYKAICNICLSEELIMDMFHIKDINIYTGENQDHYECGGKLEPSCRERRKIKAQEIAKIKEDARKAEQIKYAHLTKEGKLEAKYGVKFEDLTENPNRYRDGSIHYKHNVTDEIYSWVFVSKEWNKPTEQYTRNIPWS